MAAPKNDKARKAWLAGLKDGDEVGIQYVVGGDPRIIRIDSVDRGKIRIVHSSFRRTDGGCDCGHYLVPISEELRTKERLMKLRYKIGEAIGLGGYGLTDKQILAIAAILWPEVKT